MKSELAHTMLSQGTVLTQGGVGRSGNIFEVRPYHPVPTSMKHLENGGLINRIKLCQLWANIEYRRAIYCFIPGGGYGPGGGYPAKYFSVRPL